MLVSRIFENRVIWAVWVVLAVATLLGLARYTRRIDLPVEVTAARNGVEIVGITPDSESALGPGWPDDPSAYAIGEVEGIAIRNPWYVRLALAGHSRGQNVRLRLLDPESGRFLAAEVRAMLVRDWLPADLVTLALIALTTLGLGAFLLTRRSYHPAAVPLALALAVIGSAITLDEFGAALGPGLLRWLPGLLWAFLFPLISPAVLEFASRFPVRSTFWQRFPWVTRLAWVIALAIGFVTALGSILYVGGIARAGLWLCVVAQNILWLVMIAMVAVVGYSLWLSFRESEDWATRNRIRWVLAGVAIGGVPPLLLIYIPRLLRTAPPLPEVAGLTFLLLIPICLTVAVIRHHLLDIRIVIRQGLIYGPATLAVYVLFVSVFVGVGFVLLQRIGPDTSVTFSLLGTLTLLAISIHLLFEPLRRRLQNLVDRLFFRTRYDYGQTLRSFRQGLGQRLTGVSALGYLLTQVRNVLNPEWATVTDLTGEWSEPWDIVQPVEDAVEPEVRVPFPHLEGLELRLGPKRSGMAWHAHDLALLESLTDLTSTALQREILQRRLLAEEAEKERLGALNRLKDDFLSLVSHDLRSPLTSLTLSADLIALNAGQAGDEETRDTALRMKRAALQLGHMVERLLHTARVEAGRIDPELKACDVRECVKAVFDRHDLLADNAGVALENMVAEGITVLADPLLLQEALSNLVDNALKVSERGTSIVISAVSDEENGDCRLAVTDYGPGIPEEIRPTLFERGKFMSQQAGRTGFGLGLYLVNELIRLQGGELELGETSRKGTTFHIRLPKWTGHAQASDS